MNSKRKGSAGEREFAALCRQHGIEDARRGQQFKGGADSPDVEGLAGVHVEVKRVERLNIHDAMQQADRDNARLAVPIVAHRRNRTPWLITMHFEHWIAFYNAWRKINHRQPPLRGGEEDEGSFSL